MNTNHSSLAPQYGIESLVSFIQNHTFSKLVVLVDENTHKHCLPQLEKHLTGIIEDAEILLVPPGEGSKSPEVMSSLWQSMLELNIDRDALFLNLGGGMITDLGGFTAATYKRGLPFINVPTTLLAMVDAALGGKTGINIAGYKNQAGLFITPQAVFIENSFLHTLEKRELLSGFAELYKHALIAGGLFYEQVNKIDAVTPQTLTKNIIREACRVKLDIVESDLYEKGSRKILNLGHTIGHAVESGTMGSENELKHGEAVAVGMCIENFIAEKVTGLNRELSNEITGKLQYFYPDAFKLSFDTDAVLEFCRADKKNMGNRLSFSLLQAPGKVLTDCNPDENIISAAIEQYNEL